MCGNSVIDLGEECDCGSQGDTATGDCPTDPCCNATSCLSSTDVECRYKSIVHQILHKDWSEFMAAVRTIFTPLFYVYTVLFILLV